MENIARSEIVHLSNGIPVILQNEETAVATIYWWVKTGSADEVPSEAGFAHFLEHMLFKDSHAKETGQPSVGETARLIESLGGDINAYTSFDQTVYHVTCAAQHWEKILAILGEMIRPKKFLKKDFTQEREVILEELKRDLDSPGRQLFHELFATTFSRHPYGRPVIGFEKTLNASTVKDLEAFYRRRYISDNLGLILVGPLGERRKQILELAEKFFGASVFKKQLSKQQKVLTRPEEPPLRKKPEWKVKSFDVKTPSLGISFRVPPLDHEDIPALDLIVQILSSGELSWIYQKLFYEKSWVTDVSGGLYIPKDAGMLYFSADVDQIERIPQVVEELFLQLKRIQEEAPSHQECERVFVNVESERLYAHQTVDGIANRLGFLQFVVGDLSFDTAYLENLKSIQPEQVRQVAQKYFDWRRLSGILLLPKNVEAFDLAPLEQLSRKILGRQAHQEEAQKEEKKENSKKKAHSSSSRQATHEKKPVEWLQLSSGLKVCYQTRSRSPVMSAHISVLGGVRLELAYPIERAETDWGSSHLMALTWNKGTQTKNSRQILEMVEGRAASLEGFSGRNAVGLQLTGLARDWKVLSELLSDVIINPSFSQEELDHAKRTTEDAIRSIEDHSSQVCSQLFLQTLFETHPYGRILYGSLQSLKSIQPEKLKAFHRTWVRPERLVVSLSGPIAQSVWMPWVEELNQRLQASINHPQASLLNPSGLLLQDEPNLKGPRWTGKNYGREQEHILVGGLGIQMTSPDRWPLLVLQTILEGQSGRLFVELREKKSLAYTVSPVQFNGIEKGYLGTYIACAPQKTDEATKGIQTVLEKLVKKGLRSHEMKRAKEYLMGRRAMDMQSDGVLASIYGLECLYGLPPLSTIEFSQKIQAVTEKDIIRVCEHYFLKAAQVTSQVG